MAKLERTLTGDFDTVLARLHEGVLNASATASCEDGSDFTLNGVRCAVRMYERYSAFGGNRVAMSLTLVGSRDRLRLTAISAGGQPGHVLQAQHHRGGVLPGHPGGGSGPAVIIERSDRI